MGRYKNAKAILDLNKGRLDKDLSWICSDGIFCGECYNLRHDCEGPWVDARSHFERKIAEHEQKVNEKTEAACTWTPENGPYPAFCMVRDGEKDEWDGPCVVLGNGYGEQYSYETFDNSYRFVRLATTAEIDAVRRDK